MLPYPSDAIHLFRCSHPELIHCQHRYIICRDMPAKPWCGKWKVNRARDKVFQACDKEYLEGERS